MKIILENVLKRGVSKGMERRFKGGVGIGGGEGLGIGWREELEEEWEKGEEIG